MLEEKPRTSKFSLQKLIEEPICIFTDCVLYAIGKPVFNRFTNQTNGSWMRDASPQTNDADKFWATDETDNYNLLEFENKTYFKDNIHTK